jgi:hypothetical protein
MNRDKRDPKFDPKFDEDLENNPGIGQSPPHQPLTGDSHENQ